MANARTLRWDFKLYEDNAKEFIANVRKIHFNNRDLILSYSIYQDQEDQAFELYFSCNSENFNIGEYKTLEIAQELADEHHKNLMNINESNNC